MNEEKKNIVRAFFQEAFLQENAMDVETTTVNLDTNMTSTQTRRFYVAKRKITVSKCLKDLNGHDISSICQFLSISEMLIFRRICKSTKVDVDKCKKQAANTIGPALMQRFELPQSLMDLIKKCEGVITGSALLSVLYDEHFGNMDVDVFLEAKHAETVHTWLTEIKDTTELIMDEDLQYVHLFEDIINRDSEAKRQFSTFTCRRAKHLLYKLPLPPSLCPIQFIFLNSDKPKERVEKKFDISVLRNWFDGKELHIGFQNDIVNRTYAIQLTIQQHKHVCSEIPKARIEKYRERGFTCTNLETRICYRWFYGELIRFQLSYVDNHCFYTEISMNGCVPILFTDWINKKCYGLNRTNYGFNYGKFLDFVKVARSAGMSYSENFREVFEADPENNYKLRELYF